MEERRNWLEMPHEIMGAMILQRIGALEILKSAQKVCTTWRRICKDPAMWKIICIKRSSSHFEDTDYDIEKLIKQAVHRSCGELIDISLDFHGTDHLLDYISRCSSKLNRLCLTNCYRITGRWLNNALKRLPQLEALELFNIFIYANDFEVIGRNCPQLKSFNMKTADFDGDAHAIANSMPALRHLQLVGNTTAGDDGIRAILDGCPHLESLDLRGCLYVNLDENLEKVCRERIKDFKFKLEGYEESDMEVIDPDDINDLNDGRGMDLPDDADDDVMENYGLSGGKAISSDDDYDCSWLYHSPISSDDDYDCSWLYHSPISSDDDYDSSWLFTHFFK